MQTYAQNKMSQFEAQLQKIAEVGEDYSSEKLRGLLREANDVIREQLTLLHTLVGNQSKGDALSFLEENSSSPTTSTVVFRSPSEIFCMAAEIRVM